MPRVFVSVGRLSKKFPAQAVARANLAPAVVASPPMPQDSLSLRHRSNRTGALSSTKYCDR
jgi:hypothetical protein